MYPKSVSFLTIFLAVACIIPNDLLSQNQSQIQSVNMEATVQTNPASIRLNWKPDTLADRWLVFRKKPQQGSFSKNLATLQGGTTQYADTTVQVGKGYEYRVVKFGPQNALGAGYLSSGIQLAANHFRGRMALVMDQRLKDTLRNAIDKFKKDLTGSGWAVTPLYLDTGLAAKAVKDSITQLKNKYPDTLEAVLLLGQIPVPYSGNFSNNTVPDGHNDHTGAWPADVFYATENGAWTDLQSFDTTSKFKRNHNRPRDNKYDQSSLEDVKAGADLMIGRVDLSDLPAFNESEFTLLKRYLQKDHQYRHGNMAIQQQGVVDGNFNIAEGFGQNGYRNFSPLVGKNNVTKGTYHSALTDSSFLWSYGAGPGSMNEANGIASTSDFASDTFNGVFTMIFGSYFGDFDGENNLMRAALASKGSLLSVSWAGRPHWHYHPMGMGAPLGKAAKLTQNNAAIPPSQSSTYFTGFGAGGVYVALMGDPTLTLYPYEGPTKLTNSVVKPTGSGQSFGTVQLSWSASAGASGYYVYRYDSALDRYQVLNSTPVSGTQFEDTAVESSEHQYMVRAVRLKASPSGSYYQLSQGVFDTASSLRISGTSDPISTESLSVYPNPAKKQVQVSIPDHIHQGSLVLTNGQGKVIAKRKIEFRSNTVPFSVKGFASGVYFLKLEGAKKPVAPKKIIVH